MGYFCFSVELPPVGFIGDDLKIESGPSTSGCQSKKREFKEPEDDSRIASVSNKVFAPESQRKIKWAVNLYCEWRRNRIGKAFCPNQIINSNLDLLFQLTQVDLAYSLCRFIREVKKLDGSDYPPNTLREMIVMIQMYLQSNGINWKLLDGYSFVGLRNVLDNTMKERHAAGLGVRKSSEIITPQIERKLLESGVIGLDDPQKLLNGVIYFLGIYLALRGVAEHNSLRRPGCDPQIKITTDSRGVKCLVYREDPLTKTNQGGLNAHSKSAKIVYVYPTSDVNRDPVTYYEKYCGLLSQSCSSKKLYSRPKKITTPNQWYCDQPLGINKIKSAVKQMCKQAGIEGKYTNHSLRATCATRMFDKEVPEQLIKETTGHKSDCVRVYKRTSDKLRQQACSTIGKLDDSCNLQGETSNSVKCDPQLGKSEVKLESKVGLGELTYDQMFANVMKTKLELRKKMYPKSRLSLKRSKKLINLSKKQMVTIDVNVNVKQHKGCKKVKKEKSK